MFGWIKPGVVCRHKDAGIVNIIYSISDAYTTVEYASYIPYCKRHNWDLIITVERQWEPVSDTPTWIQEGLHIIDNRNNLFVIKEIIHNFVIFEDGTREHILNIGKHYNPAVYSMPTGRHKHRCITCYMKNKK